MALRHCFCGASVLILLAGCGGEADVPEPAPVAVDDAQADTGPTPSQMLADLGVSAGIYELEKTHASLVWTVSHNGLSKYTTRFTEFDATIELDAEAPERSSLVASINPLSVRTDHPSGPDWDITLASDAKWFNAEAFPAITYRSTEMTDLGGLRGRVHGDLSLLGVTQPVALDVTMNGVRNFPWYGERDVIGFSATATLKRSDFGMLALLPEIGDEVSIQLEVEFVQAE